MPRDILIAINSITRKVVEEGLVDHENQVSLQQSNNKTIITWAGQTDISYILKGLHYTDVYNRLESENQYNFKMLDGALVQMMYMFRGRRLISHRLAFYPNPFLHTYQDEPEIYNNQELYGDIVSKELYPFPIRFDYDPEQFVDVDHPESHLTLGQYKNCRIPVYAPLCPYQYVNFILRNFYSTDERILDLFPTSKYRMFTNTITDNERNLLHLNLTR